jgi:hypothetical protein
MDLVKNIPHYLVSKNDKYIIKIGHPSDLPIDGLYNLNTFNTILIISNKLSVFSTVILFNELLYSNNNNNASEIILSDICKIFTQYKSDIIIKIENANKLDKIKYKLTKQEIWILAFAELIFVQNYNRVANDNCIALFSSFYKDYPDNKRRVDTLIKNEKENFSMSILWKEFNNYKEAYGIDSSYVICIESSDSLQLSIVKYYLEKFLNNDYNINEIVNTLCKALKVYKFDEYNNPKIKIEDNYKYTPIVHNRLIKLNNRFPKDCFELSMKYLFRSTGIYLNFTESIYLSLMILYSDYKIDENLELYLKTIVSNNNGIHCLLNSLATMSTNMLYSHYIKILFYSNKEKSKKIFGGRFNELVFNSNNYVSKIPLISRLNINCVLVHIFVQNFISFFKEKLHLLFKDSMESFIKKRMYEKLSAFPFTEENNKFIVNFIWKHRYNIIGKNMIGNVNGNVKNKDYLKDNTVFNLIKILHNDIIKNNALQYKLDSYYTNFKLEENNKYNSQIYQTFDKLIFKNFIKKCNLCEEITFMDSSSLHNLDCGKHTICNECANKLYRTPNYNQGDYVNERNFVCSFCRTPERNIIFKIPMNFYDNISNHRLCSYVNCTQIVNTNIQRVCNNEEVNDLLPIYCNHHQRIIDIMSQYKITVDELSIKMCPGCDVTINKIDGCNHMKCNCGKHFCWVCDYSQDVKETDTYNHPSFCRGNHSWEEGLNKLQIFSNDFNNQIIDMSLNNQEVHIVYGNWVKEMIMSPKINAASFWDLNIWVNRQLNQSFEMINIDATNISLYVSYLCEWIISPDEQNIFEVIANLVNMLQRLNEKYPAFFVIPPSEEEIIVQ